MGLEGIKNYLLSARFDGSMTWETGQMGPLKTWMAKYADPRYEFNGLERAGNYLLDVPTWVLVTYKLTKESYFYVMLAVVAVAAVPIGLVGFMFKTVGEQFNPLNTKRNAIANQAWKANLEMIRLLQGQSFEGLAVTPLELTRDFARFLKNNHQATPQEIASLTLFDRYSCRGSGRSMFDLPEETRSLQTCRRQAEQWKCLWQTYTEACVAGRDTSQAEAEIQALVREDEPFVTSLQAFFDDMSTDPRKKAPLLVQGHVQLAPKAETYNALISTMRG